MKTDGSHRELQAADPAAASKLDQLELGPAEAALAEAIVAESAGGEEPSVAATPWTSAGSRRRHRQLGLAGTIATAAAAAVALLLLLGGGTSKSPPIAYGAQLVRFAESTPLLLLEGPSWRVEDVAPNPVRNEGSMEFVTGKPIPDEEITVTGNMETGQHVSGMAPAAVRQRRVNLNWYRGSLRKWMSYVRSAPSSVSQRWTKAPVLDTTALVNTRAEVYVNQGGPGDRQMTAYWAEGGYVLELRAFVPDLAALEERLDWLAKVDPQTWLAAMPPKIVKSADRDAVVREMLEGIPVPPGFGPDQVPEDVIATSRYHVGAAVTGTVSCLWFRQWGSALRTGDRAARIEAERAMATSKNWPILREMAKDGAYPATVWRLAASMPSNEWRPGQRLLPHAEGLGCALWGVPVLPWKQRRQNERGM